MELCKAFNPNSSQVTVLGVNDETLGVIEIQVCFDHTIATHRESYF
jgi:hypothetical protein